MVKVKRRDVVQEVVLEYDEPVVKDCPRSPTPSNQTQDSGFDDNKETEELEEEVGVKVKGKRSVIAYMAFKSIIELVYYS